MRKRPKTSVYLTLAQTTALKKISDRTGIPQSVLIRRGVEMAIKKYRKVKS
jgi:hypothetical protein